MNKKYRDVLLMAEEFLDRVDLRNYLKPGRDLYDVMEEIERDTKTLMTDEENEYFEGEIFNYMDQWEFGNYLTRKYNVSIIEDLSITYRIGRLS